ncbi:histidine kinase [Nitriliruptor alkaliphilus]|uniref:sensor histidine kinase n=1 Tax=Nitriliruptor alkaliphilus TaxID=427918 RepID=UPI0006981A65|nr:histidine kinase [Nitriliruptor alkaliphilus]
MTPPPRLTGALQPSWATRAAFVLSGAGVAMFCATIWLTWSTRGVALPSGFEPGTPVPLLVALLLFVGAGGLVATQRPRYPVGWVVLSIGLLWQLIGLAGVVRIVSHDGGGASPWAAWIWDVLWFQALVLVVLLFLVFPDGRLPSRRWRPAAWLLATASVLILLAMGLHPGRLWETPVDNPLGVEAYPAVFGAMDAVGSIAAFVSVFAGLAAPVVRYRRADLTERYQLKWFLATCVLVFVTWSVVDLARVLGAGHELLFTVRTFPIAALPVAIAFAVVRYRLYEIDRLITKALLYTGLASVVALLYLGTVVGIGTMIGGRTGADVPLTVLATALVAVAFQPARVRLQQLANRVVYGQRSSPYEVLASFTERVTDAYPTGQAPAAMARVVAEGLRLVRCDVWLGVDQQLHLAGRWPEPLPAGAPAVLRHPIGLELPDTDGSYPVHHDGRLLGVIAITTRGRDPLVADEDRLLRNLAAAAWLVLDNAQLVSELRASRQRLVTAQDSERRRIERDLHDGAQHRLLELALTLRGVHDEADGRGQPTSTIVAAEGQLRSALAELRDLARGIHPAVLTEQGLAAALEAMAERAPLPVRVAAPGIGRVDAPIEATAYFVAAEALNNIIKHAGAQTATIDVRRVGGQLLLTIVDDGWGGADTTAPGLSGLADRVAAMHGSFDVTSPTGEGTRVEVVLPCV